MKEKLTQKRLKELLHYDPETGLFTNITNRAPRALSGTIAGCTDIRGYVFISINNVRYRAHRLAFLYMDGYLPENDVDHINRDTSDNRWCNLRHVSRQCNLRNSKDRKDNTSGVTGVFYHKKNKRWCVRVTINNRNINIGCYKLFKDAVYVRWKAEKKYNFPNCNTKSSAYKYLKDNGWLK